MVHARKLLVLATATLAGLGLLMVYSASITAQPSFADQRAFARQCMFLVAGIVLAAAASRVPAELWRRAAWPFMLASIAALAVLLVPGAGVRLNGARRWFWFGGVSVQPSELAKIAIVLFLAHTAAAKGDAVRRFWSGWIPLTVLPIVASGLVLVEPDFGTAVFMLAMMLLILFLAGVPLWHLMFAGAATACVAVVLAMAQPYRVTRVLQFVAAWSDPNAAPYQVQQSLVALGSGGLWGAGLGRGWQKLGFLPQDNTDFVFAIIGEELGLVGTLTVLALWAVFLVCGMRLAQARARDKFAFLVSFGLVAQLVLQAMINVGVVTASLPPKGIPLPFISAGGSNLVTSLVAVGIVLGLTREPEGEASRVPACAAAFANRAAV